MIILCCIISWLLDGVRSSVRPIFIISLILSLHVDRNAGQNGAHVTQAGALVSNNRLSSRGAAIRGII